MVQGMAPHLPQDTSRYCQITRLIGWTRRQTTVEIDAWNGGVRKACSLSMDEDLAGGRTDPYWNDAR